MSDKKENLLNQIGIDVNDKKIAIDTKKTKDFFCDMKQKLQDTAESLHKNIKEGSADFSQSVGVKIDDEHIDVDLHKTRNFIEEVGRKIEHFLAQLEHSVDDLSKK